MLSRLGYDYFKGPKKNDRVQSLNPPEPLLSHNRICLSDENRARILRAFYRAPDMALGSVIVAINGDPNFQRSEAYTQHNQFLLFQNTDDSTDLNKIKSYVDYCKKRDPKMSSSLQVISEEMLKERQPIVATRLDTAKAEAEKKQSGIDCCTRHAANLLMDQFRSDEKFINYLREKGFSELPAKKAILEYLRFKPHDASYTYHFNLMMGVSDMKTESEINGLNTLVIPPSEGCIVQ
jgi:hypothetical protein